MPTRPKPLGINDLELKDRPNGMELFNTPLCVFWSEAEQSWACVHDLCPHRQASLSLGYVTPRGVRCRYHGWEFDSSGRCVHIPTLDEAPTGVCSKRYEVRAHQQVLWLFAGPRGEAATTPTWNIPHYDEIAVDSYVRDVEYDWIFSNEHNIDIAHVPWAHPETLQPMEEGVPFVLEVEKDWRDGFDGIRARYEHIWRGHRNDDATQTWFAPHTALNLVNLHLFGKDQVVGHIFHATPLGYGRTRVFFRSFRSFMKFEHKPSFLRHMHRSRVVEEDGIIIANQTRQISKVDCRPGKRGMDELQRRYRQWLDERGGSFWIAELKQAIAHQNLQARTGHGVKSSLYEQWSGNEWVFDRHIQHTRICRRCLTWRDRFSKLRGAALVLFAVWLVTLALGLWQRAGTAGTVAAGLAFVLIAAMGLTANRLHQQLSGKRY